MVVALVSVGIPAPSLASADGATQISGLGEFSDFIECNNPQGSGTDFPSKISGDLEGYLYVFVETYESSPSGTYRENGREIFVGWYDGEFGMFETTYLFTAKYEDVANLAGQKFGRCQHPILAGSDTGVFEGVSGRLDFKGDVEAGNFPYRGHLRW
jgi:hypothetical protein